jgi:hypothetical protein
MDYTAADAVAAGFDRAVLIVREEVQEELLEHIGKYWPSELEVVPVIQGPIAGTAQAVASARKGVSGAFGVVNADDLYGPAALSMLASEVRSLGERTQVIVGYRLGDTILTDAVVTRGVCETDPDGNLVRIVEQEVRREGDGYVGRPIGSRDEVPWEPLGPDTVVSMNLWGLAESMLDHLDAALASFDPSTAPHSPGKPPELLLPSVVGGLVADGEISVRVRPTGGRCVGLTHPDDVALVREIVAADRHPGSG